MCVWSDALSNFVSGTGAFCAYVCDVEFIVYMYKSVYVYGGGKGWGGRWYVDVLSTNLSIGREHIL